jgi:outer membrane protein OmpA-like peptidoglycan-associated protein
MKKLLFTLVFASAITTLSAQTETEKDTQNNFNKWSIELAAGANQVSEPLSIGYYTGNPGFLAVDLGARYMFNNKFGLKAELGYDNFAPKPGSNSKDFNTNYYRFDVQGVANLGRIMNFETWTNTIGLLSHAGAGVAYMNGDNFNKDQDNLQIFIAGITTQVKLTNRIVLTADITTILNGQQDFNFDGGANFNQRGYKGHVYNGTIGLTVYLGGNENHLDWSIDNRDALEIEALKEKVASIENSLMDTDRDGVINSMDEEQNTISGVAVNTKGKAIDLNNNGVPDELDTYMNNTYIKISDKTSNEMINKLINNNYVTASFDNNSSIPTGFSVNGMNYILTYLKNNPTATMDIVGHTDEVGSVEANNKLSVARAESIKKILVEAKIDAARLNVIGAGKSNAIDVKSEAARKLYRTVTFTVK